MKKISFVSAIALAAVSLVGISPAQATQSETIAIIDAHFDASIPGTHICVADVGCETNISNAASHGSQMANIVIKNNPNAKLVLIRAGSFSKGSLSFPNAREISNAIQAVPTNASVVSISIFNNSGMNNCRPSTSSGNGTKNPLVSLEVKRTTDSINQIVSRGGAVLAAAGNGPAKNARNLDYPACLPNVTSVARGVQGSGFLTQGKDHPELDLALVATNDVGQFRTTSGLTAALASRWSSVKNSIVANSKQFLVLDVVN
jgi:hypothetical protein